MTSGRLSSRSFHQRRAAAADKGNEIPSSHRLALRSRTTPYDIVGPEHYCASQQHRLLMSELGRCCCVLKRPKSSSDPPFPSIMSRRQHHTTYPQLDFNTCGLGSGMAQTVRTESPRATNVRAASMYQASTPVRCLTRRERTRCSASKSICSGVLIDTKWHGRSLHRLRNRLGVAVVVLVSLEERLHLWNQPPLEQVFDCLDEWV